MGGRPPRTGGRRSGGTPGRPGRAVRQGTTLRLGMGRRLSSASARPGGAGRHHTERGRALRVAAIQLNSTPDRGRTLETADRLVREAAGRGAGLVLLPEKWPALGTPEETAAAAEPLDGPSLTWAREVARELGIALVAGSVVEHGDERHHNTCVHVGP